MSVQMMPATSYRDDGYIPTYRLFSRMTAPIAVSNATASRPGQILTNLYPF